MPTFRDLSRLLLAVVVSLQVNSAVRAGSPRILFDHSRVITCAEIAPSGCADLRPGEKLVEVKVCISVLVVEGNESDVEHVMIEIFNPTQQARVVGFAPKTLLESPFVGDVEVTTTSERSKTFGVNLGTGLTLPQQQAIVQVTPALDVGKARRDSTTEKARRVAPKTLALASGTIHGRTGVFFKLKRSMQDALQGDKEFTIQFAVPSEWKSGELIVLCRARVRTKVFFLDRSQDCCLHTGRLTILQAPAPDHEGGAQTDVETATECAETNQPG